MEVVTDPNAARTWVREHQRAGRTVGLVPTMGALHQGHMALVDAANQQCDVSAVTIFVNPTQFAPHEDLARYPRTLADDLERCRQRGTGLVFTPDVDAVYPRGFSTYVEPPAVSQSLEGEARPGHYRGVATVVLKLFQILPCDQAFFGQKDYQQVLVVRHMARDLDLATEIITCPTVRETDGLAMSSRNRYLNDQERLQSLGLSEALQAAQRMVSEGETQVSVIEKVMRERLAAKSITKIDYAVVRHADTLEWIDRVEDRAVALIAAYVGQTRLIDNCLLETGASPRE